MKWITTICCLFFAVLVHGQEVDYGALPHAVGDLDKALETNDTIALKWLVAADVSYGHSNGWVENKQEMMIDLYNGKLKYKSVKSSKPEIKHTGSTAWVRTQSEIEAVLAGKPATFSLKVLQVWVWENTHWVLFARQSVPLSNEK